MINKNKIEHIIPEYNSKIDNVIRIFLKSDNDLDDIKQEVYIKLWKNLSNYQEGKNFWAWIRKITINHCKNHLRGKKIVIIDLPEDNNIEYIENISNEKQLISIENQKTILEAINKLDKKLKDVIILYDFENLSYEEITKRVNCPLGTVKSRLYRARIILKELLKDLMNNDE